MTTNFGSKRPSLATARAARRSTVGLWRPSDGFLYDLEVDVGELVERVEELEAIRETPETRALVVRARQCRDALRACRRTPFEPQLIAKLVFKCRGVQDEAARILHDSSDIVALFAPEAKASRAS